MKIMLLRFVRGRLIGKLFFLLVNTAIFSLLWVYYRELSTFPLGQLATSSNNGMQRNTKHVAKLMTAVIRQFDEYDNDITESVQSITVAFPNMYILIVCDRDPYPPFAFMNSNITNKRIKIISLELRLDGSPTDYDPLNFVKTDYVLFIPDGAKVSRKALHQAIGEIDPSVGMALGTSGSKLTCQKITWDYENWTLQYRALSDKSLCDGVKGTHALLVTTALLRTLPQPFLLPFPEAMYLQMAVRGDKVSISGVKLGGSKRARGSVSRQRAGRAERERRAAFYRAIGAKMLVAEDARVQMYGCTKDTERCRGGGGSGADGSGARRRNTAPCCRRHVRRAVAHVLRALHDAGARVWLDGTTLLAALTSGEVLPWVDYAEVGIMAEDVARVGMLARGGADDAGYWWERATKGDYYRVAYSKTNRIYVLVLPWAGANGTMRPRGWVVTHHPPFPERHLHPVAQVTFAGMRAPVPNDAHAFLDLKFGANSIQRSQRLGYKFLEQ